MTTHATHVYPHPHDSLGLRGGGDRGGAKVKLGTRKKGNQQRRATPAPALGHGPRLHEGTCPTHPASCSGGWACLGVRGGACRRPPQKETYEQLCMTHRFTPPPAYASPVHNPPPPTGHHHPASAFDAQAFLLPLVPSPPGKNRETSIGPATRTQQARARTQHYSRPTEQKAN
jgi:hypothetical protein